MRWTVAALLRPITFALAIVAAYLLAVLLGPLAKRPRARATIA